VAAWWFWLIPVGFLILGAFAKRLASNTTQVRDLYLGIDFTLVSLSSAILNGLDLIRQTKDMIPPQGHEKLKFDVANEQIRSWVCAFVCFAAFVAVAIIHRQWEHQTTAGWRERCNKEFWMVVMANVVGASSLLFFTQWVKGY
jgi:hypothetical protein